MNEQDLFHRKLLHSRGCAGRRERGPASLCSVSSLQRALAIAVINSCTLHLLLVLHGNEESDLGVLTSSACVFVRPWG